jgi:hypothetical protein
MRRAMTLRFQVLNFDSNLLLNLLGSSQSIEENHCACALRKYLGCMANFRQLTKNLHPLLGAEQ